MAQTIKSVKQKLKSGVYSNPIPFGANGVNIDMANGYDLEATLGTVDVANKGNVQAQLNKHTQDIATNKANIEGNDRDIIGLQSRASTIEASVAANNAAIKANTTRIENNTANITSNDNDILALQNRATVNEANISKNTTAISQNTTDITELQKDILANKTSIQTHTADITSLNTTVTTEIQRLEKNIHDIDAAYGGDVSEIVTRVDALESNDKAQNTTIGSHTTDITKLKNDVENNTSDIADRVTKKEAYSFISDVGYNAVTYTLTFSKYDGTSKTIELPLENIIDRGYFDETTEELVLVLGTGEEIRIPANSLITDYEGEDNLQIKVDVSSTNKISATLKEKSLDESFFSEALQQRLDNMEDVYSKTEIDNKISAKTEFQEVQSW